MVEFAPKGEILLVGGWSGTNEIAGTMRWTGSSFTGHSMFPGNRDSVGLAYDVSRQVVVLFGGNGGSCNGDCSETWEYGY